MKKRSRVTDLEASIYKIGWLRLNMGAAYALGQEPMDDTYFERPLAERNLLRVELVWDRQSERLTLRGGKGPFKLHVYSRSLRDGELKKSIRPLFMILVPKKFLRASKGLWVPSTRRFILEKVADRTLVLDRAGGGVKVTHRRPHRPKRPYRRNLK